MQTLHEIADRFKHAERVVVATHRKPDGDAVGSALALRRLLAAAGVRAVVADLGLYPERYAFLVGPGETADLAACRRMDPDLIAVLDCGEAGRAELLDTKDPPPGEVVNIDHHAGNTGFGGLNYVDTGASSAGELIYRLAVEAGWDVSRDVAEPLWVAIVTDTGRFAYSNTAPGTLDVAAALLRTGIAPDVLDRRLYRSKPLREVLLQAHALAKLDVCLDGRVALMGIDTADFQACGAEPRDTEDLVNIAASIDGVEVAILFYEMDGGARTCVSFRSKPPFDVAAFARELGGGGHPRAAGCRLPGPLPRVRETVLAKLEAGGLI